MFCFLPADILRSAALNKDIKHSWMIKICSPQLPELLSAYNFNPEQTSQINGGRQD